MTDEEVAREIVYIIMHETTPNTVRFESHIIKALGQAREEEWGKKRIEDLCVLDEMREDLLLKIEFAKEEYYDKRFQAAKKKTIEAANIVISSMIGTEAFSCEIQAIEKVITAIEAIAVDDAES